MDIWKPQTPALKVPATVVTQENGWVCSQKVVSSAAEEGSRCRGLIGCRRVREETFTRSGVKSSVGRAGPEAGSGRSLAEVANEPVLLSRGDTRFGWRLINITGAGWRLSEGQLWSESGGEIAIRPCGKHSSVLMPLPEPVLIKR